MLNRDHNQKHQERLRPPLMSTSTSAKPKAKFSSRNLSAVFKAPLRSKPLPDHKATSNNNSNSRMLVLGRAVAAAPAPINTPSLKRESQAHDVHVSLVPAGSNWAENAHKQQKPEGNDASGPAPLYTEVPEKVWTPESVAEHLHTARAATTRPKVVTENSGRWGDDAVEQDLVRSNVRRQRQKEREFPDLKEAVEDAQMHHAADRSPSRGVQQTEQQHGRATGRWAHFSEQEMQYPSQDDRWSRDRYGEDERWSRDRVGRDDGHRDRYSRDEDDRSSRGRYDDGSGHSNAVCPDPNDSHTHFSRSDARFDVVASGDRDRVLSHSPHRMDWSGGRLGRRSDRSSSPTPLHGHEDAHFHTPQPHRSRTQSPASVSPSRAHMTPQLTADATPARVMSWRSMTSTDRGSERAWGTQQHIDRPVNADEPSIAEAAESCTDSSSNSCASSPAQQVQLLKRPKMLFDPKTGGLVSAEDKASSEAGKRQSSRRRGKDRESANAPVAKAQNTAKSSDARKPEAESKVSSAKINNSENPRFEEEAPVAVIAVNTVQEIGSETSSSISSDAVLADQITGSADGVSSKKKYARVTERPARQQTASRATNSKSGPRSKKHVTSLAPQRQSPAIAAADTETKRGKRTSISTRNDRRAAGGDKRSSGHTIPQKVKPTEAALLRQIAEGANGNVVLITQEQEGIDVSPEDDGFETVKPRRVVLSEKKRLRQRLASGEAIAKFVDEKKSARASASEERAAKQSKGEGVQETLDSTSKQVDTQFSSKPRGKAGKDRKQAKLPKPRTKEYKQKVVSEQPAAKRTQSEQVAGEAPAESPLPKRKSQSAKATAEVKRESKPRKQSAGRLNLKPSDRKETSNTAERKKETDKRQSTERSSGDVDPKVEKVPAGKAPKARPKQVRKMYVVKTPAPAAATSTAA